MPTTVGAPYQRVIGTSPDSKDVLLQGAVEGHVLLKNTNGALPLKSPKLISLFGYSAKSFDRYSWGTPGWNSGSESLLPEQQSTASTVRPQVALNGTLPTGGGSGANQPAYMSSVFEALSQRAYDDGTHLWWDFHFDKSTVVDQSSDACIVAGNAYAAEGFDRSGYVTPRLLRIQSVVVI
jgi:beta-glucosidase